MSSLAAARADNFYFPPEWRPEMGGISKFQGSKGANQYEQYGIIRFELPFDGWCLKCNQHMSKGLRFNAKKDRSGKYFSTTIWSFTTKCYACEQQFVIRTDPKNNTYDFAEGLRKHEQDYVPEFEDGAIEVLDDEAKQQIKVDPMFRLQHDQECVQKAKNENERLSDLQSLQQSNKSDYDQNSILRKRVRDLKKQDQARRDEARQKGLAIPLLDVSETDRTEAKKIKFKHLQKDQFVIQEKKKFAQLQSQSIFNNNNNNSIVITNALQQQQQKKKAPSTISSIMIDKLVNRHLSISHFQVGDSRSSSSCSGGVMGVEGVVAIKAHSKRQQHDNNKKKKIVDSKQINVMKKHEGSCSGDKKAKCRINEEDEAVSIFDVLLADYGDDDNDADD